MKLREPAGSSSDGCVFITAAALLPGTLGHGVSPRMCCLKLNLDFGLETKQDICVLGNNFFLTGNVRLVIHWKVYFICIYFVPKWPQVSCESSLLRPIFPFIVRQRPLVGVVISRHPRRKSGGRPLCPLHAPPDLQRCCSCLSFKPKVLESRMSSLYRL